MSEGDLDCLRRGCDHRMWKQFFVSTGKAGGTPAPKVVVEKEKVKRYNPCPGSEDQVKERRQGKLHLGVKWYRRR